LILFQDDPNELKRTQGNSGSIKHRLTRTRTKMDQETSRQNLICSSVDLLFTLCLCVILVPSYSNVLYQLINNLESESIESIESIESMEG
jgi:hypothetical protein